MTMLVTVSGPPSSGKTSIIIKTVSALRRDGLDAGVVKFDCLSTVDGGLYEKAGIQAAVGLSGNLCPDHFFASNVEESLAWGQQRGLPLVLVESAGLCNRCSPHIKGILAICVIDCLAGVSTPKKIGPMLKLADAVVISKGDIVSQAEREVMAFRTKQANPKASIIAVNGITGQGAGALALLIRQGAAPQASIHGSRLRFSMPMALCSYCLGETKLGEEFQRGYVRKVDWCKGNGVVGG
jgi:Ni2+-binding GTPase involved in maturation of urease and hydrogenase